MIEVPKDFKPPHYAALVLAQESDRWLLVLEPLCAELRDVFSQIAHCKTEFSKANERAIMDEVQAIQDKARAEFAARQIEAKEFDKVKVDRRKARENAKLRRREIRLTMQDVQHDLEALMAPLVSECREIFLERAAKVQDDFEAELADAGGLVEWMAGNGYSMPFEHPAAHYLRTQAWEAEKQVPDWKVAHPRRWFEFFGINFALEAIEGNEGGKQL